MGETITLNVKLRAFVRKEKKGLWVSICPRINVASQGITRDKAMASLKEAIELWFESCLERGVLDQAMREVSMRPLADDERPGPNDEVILVDHRRSEADGADIRGDLFSVQIDIPAYQAAAFTSSPS